MSEFISVKAGWLTDDADEKCGIWLQRSHETGRRIINFEDQAVRDALIALGWTPPKGKPE